MKTKNYVLLFGLLLSYGVQFSYGQCGVVACDDKSITCGSTVKLDAFAKWSETIDNAAHVVGFRSVYFLSADTGYTVGENGLIHRTFDGGKTWTSHDKSGNSFRSVFFTDANTGFIVGKNDSNGSVILKTIDGGNNWTTQTFANEYGLASVYFTDKNTGFAAGSGVIILKTTDGGATWVHKTVFATDHFISINFPQPTIGYAIGEVGTICKTTDRGENWTTQSIGGSTFCAYFTNANIGFVGSREGVILKTRDGGNSWVTQKIGNVNDTIKAIFFVDSTVGYAGSRQTIWKTTDGGLTWKKQLTEANINAIFFPNGKVGYATGTQTLKLIDPASITWSPSFALSSTSIPDPIAEPTKTITYKVTIVTPDGCSASDSVTVFVNPLIANAGSDKIITCGDSIQLDIVQTNYIGITALTYYWSPPEGLNPPWGVVTVANPTTTTLYKVTVSNDKGCDATDSVLVNVAPLTANAGVDKLHVCGNSVQFDKVLSNYTGTSPLAYSWSPATGLNNTALPDPVSTGVGITYTVTVTTSNGCQASDQVKVDLKKMEAIEICMVGVDSIGKNIVFWEYPAAVTIDSVVIYRETSVTNNFVKIGTAAYGKGKFIDDASQPNVKSDKYRISILDTCGLESSPGVAHKTMHLSINKGVGTSWNLIWEGYEGFSIPTYNIYRGTDKLNLQLNDAVSGTTTQYTDYNPPPGVLYYQIQAVNPHPCSAANGVSARSNITTGNPVGIKQFSNELNFSIYPNPANSLLMVNLENITINKNLTLTIYNAIGVLVKTVPLEQDKQQINISDLDNGFYSIEIKSANYSGQQKLVIQK